MHVMHISCLRCGVRALRCKSQLYVCTKTRRPECQITPTHTEVSWLCEEKRNRTKHIATYHVVAIRNVATYLEYEPHDILSASTWAHYDDESGVMCKSYKCHFFSCLFGTCRASLLAAISVGANAHDMLNDLPLNEWEAHTGHRTLRLE